MSEVLWKQTWREKVLHRMVASTTIYYYFHRHHHDYWS
jgi:hypothetical protein